jgi:hypothetical protein
MNVRRKEEKISLKELREHFVMSPVYITSGHEKLENAGILHSGQ